MGEQLRRLQRAGIGATAPLPPLLPPRLPGLLLLRRRLLLLPAAVRTCCFLGSRPPRRRVRQRVADAGGCGGGGIAARLPAAALAALHTTAVHGVIYLDVRCLTSTLGISLAGLVACLVSRVCCVIYNHRLISKIC